MDFWPNNTDGLAAKNLELLGKQMKDIGNIKPDKEVAPFTRIADRRSGRTLAHDDQPDGGTAAPRGQHKVINDDVPALQTRHHGYPEPGARRHHLEITGRYASGAF
jgi:hypothetical protein